ncbi:MAG: DUF86 domain-containing protein [Kaiparowitsia implicata GSE-PSE-MK54-09C]|nr:DUF86 domain-containing protein [Kaiparowitsia implicata GSE-PSE-MK54-09C]
MFPQPQGVGLSRWLETRFLCWWQYPEVPWSKIIGMRNTLTHNYFEIGLDMVWLAVKQGLLPW